MSSMTDAKNELKAVLERWMPAELARLNAAFNDGVIAEPPMAYSTAETATIEGFPWVEFIGVRSVPKGRDEYVQEYEHEISIIWTIIGFDEQIIVKQIERSILATRNILWRGQLDGSTMPIRSGAEDYSMLGHTKPGFAAPLIKGGAITVYITGLDDDPFTGALPSS